MARRTDSEGSAGRSPAEHVRAAVEQAIGATTSSPVRERALELAEELAGAAGRVRELFDDLRVGTPADDVAPVAELDRLRARVEALETRVATLEARPAPRPRATAKSKAAGTPTAGRATRRSPAASDA